MVKRVLIIGYLHPYTRPGGSFRVLPLLRNLGEHGWEPEVVTPKLLSPPEAGITTHETDYGRMLGGWERVLGVDADGEPRAQLEQRLGGRLGQRLPRFLLTRAGEIWNYPDAHKSWLPYALTAAREVLRQDNYDAILSCHPMTSHIVAGRLKAEFGLPWVADFPDLWSGNHNYGYGRWRHALDGRLEKKTLAAANTLTTVSRPWAEKLEALHKGKPVRVVTHGFNPLEGNQPPAPLTEKFTISYTGIIYPDKQDVITPLAALSGLIARGALNPEETELRLYGPAQKWLQEAIERLGLLGVVRQYGAVSREEAVARQRESQLLLLLDWNDPGERGVYPGKVFEYLAARRPILATGGISGNVIDELLMSTGAGSHAPSVADVTGQLEQYYGEFRQNGHVAFHGDLDEIEQYSQGRMAGAFASILDGLVNGK